MLLVESFGISFLSNYDKLYEASDFASKCLVEPILSKMKPYQKSRTFADCKVQLEFDPNMALVLLLEICPISLRIPRGRGSVLSRERIVIIITGSCSNSKTNICNADVDQTRVCGAHSHT